MQTNTLASKVLPAVVAFIEMILYPSTSLPLHWDAKGDANKGEGGLPDLSLL